MQVKAWWEALSEAPRSAVGAMNAETGSAASAQFVVGESS